MRKYSRRFQKVLEAVNKKQLYLPLDALNLLKDLSNVNFIETAEAHIALNLDPKYADQQLRSTVILPNGTGKDITVAVLTQEDKIPEALASGADIVGSQDLIEEISKGRLDFDKLIATPDIMLMVARLGRILGPRGLMPSPKAGTVTNELAKTIQEFKAGKLEYRLDRTGIVHVPFGKLSFSKHDLFINLKSLQESIDKNKPPGSKGKYWKSMYLSSTMGPSIPIDISFLRDTVI